MRHLIQKEGAEYGPYSVEEIRGYVDRGSVLTTDLARGESCGAWAPVGDVLTASPYPAGQAARSYFIWRGNQQYGPYSLDTVRTLVAQGRLQLTDAARTEEQQTWTILGALLRPRSQSAPPLPPALHWAVALLLTGIGGGLFVSIWMMVQAAWVKKINPRSKAMHFSVAFLVFSVLAFSAYILCVGVAASSGGDTSGEVTSAIVTLFAALLALGAAGGGFMLAGIFSMRKSIETYYNTEEPIGLRLSGVMTFFFHVIYLQYHLRRIANGRRATDAGSVC